MKKHICLLAALLAALLSLAPWAAQAEEDDSVIRSGSQLAELLGEDIGDAPRTGSLTLSGCVPDKAVMAFLRAYPDIDVRFDTSVTAAETLRRLTLHDDAVDIYEVRVDYAFSQLVDKGLAVPLTASAALARDVAGLDENVRAALCAKDGAPMAYPSQIRFIETSVDEAWWTRLTGGAPLPETWNEVLDAWLEWETDWASFFPGVGFMALDFDHAALAGMIVKAYVREAGSDDGAPDMGSPALREALEKLEAVRDIRLELGRGVHGEEDPLLRTDGETGARPIFSLSDTGVPIDTESMQLQQARPAGADEYGMPRTSMTPVPLRFDAAAPARTDVSLEAYIINPYGAHAEEALRFLEILTDRDVDFGLYYAVHPGANEPYENPDFEEYRAWYQRRKEEAEAGVVRAKQTGEDASRLESELAFLNEWFASEDRVRYYYSAETIAAYRARVAAAPLRLYARSPYISSGDSVEGGVLEDACARYAAGLLTLDGFLKELAAKMTAIALENE